MLSGNWAASRYRIARYSERHPRQRCGVRPKTPGEKEFSVRPGGFLNLRAPLPCAKPLIGGIPRNRDFAAPLQRLPERKLATAQVRVKLIFGLASRTPQRLGVAGLIRLYRYRGNRKTR